MKMLESDWNIVSFGELVKNKDSKRVPLKESDRIERHGIYPYYGASGVIDYVDDYLYEGTYLLIGEDGANLLARSTPIAFLADGKFWVNNHAHVLEATDRAELKYLKYYFETLDLEPYVTGSAQPKLTRKSLDRIPVPLPSLAEQRRIAAILDRADAVRRKRQEAIALTEELLRSAFLEMFGDPVTNPKGWKISPLGEIAQFIGGGTPSRKEPKYFEGDICWATSKDMSVDVLFNTEEHITPEAIKDSATKLVEPGCLLLVVKSKILMRRLPVARTVVPTCFSQDIKAVIPNQNWMVRYLHRHLRFGEITLLQQARGVNTEGLTLEHLRNYPVMLPPKPDIQNFTNLDVAIDNGATIRKSSAGASENLFNSLLLRAFRGEL